MARRSKDWNEGLAKDLRDLDFAQTFIMEALDAGIAVQIALGKAIRAYGVKEFAKKCGMAAPNVLRAIDPKYNPTQETLNRLLKPFGLKVAIAPISTPKKAA